MSQIKFSSHSYPLLTKGLNLAASVVVVSGSVLLSAACAHPQPLDAELAPPSVERVIEPPAVASTVRLEPVGLMHLMRGLYFLSNGRASASIPHLRLALIHAENSPFIHAKLAMAWAMAGDLEQATQTLYRGLAFNPEDPQLNRWAGHLAMQAWRYDEALPYLQRAIAAPDSADKIGTISAAVSYIDALFWTGQATKALRQAAQFLEAPSISADLALSLGACLEDHGTLEVALAAYRRTRLLRPADREAALGEARIQELLGHEAEAAASLVSLAAFYPETPEISVYMMRLLRLAHKDGAEAYRIEALRQSDGDPEGWLLVATGDLYSGQTAQALELLRHTIQTYPTALEARFYLAEALLHGGDAKGCLQVLETGREMLPRESLQRLHSIRASCYAALGQGRSVLTELIPAVLYAADARAALSDAARLLTQAATPETVARSRFKELLAHLGKHISAYDAELAMATLVDLYGHGEEALARLDTVIQSEAGVFSLLPQRAEIQARYGQLELAVTTLEELLRQNPNDILLLNTLGFILADAGHKLETASVWLRRAYRLAPDEGFIIDSLGWLLFKQARYTESIKLLERARYALPDDPEVLRHLGDAYRAVARFADARLMYEQALAAPSLGGVLHQLLKERLATLNPGGRPLLSPVTR